MYICYKSVINRSKIKRLIFLSCIHANALTALKGFLLLFFKLSDALFITERHRTNEHYWSFKTPLKSLKRTGGFSGCMCPYTHANNVLPYHWFQSSKKQNKTKSPTTGKWMASENEKATQMIFIACETLAARSRGVRSACTACNTRNHYAFHRNSFPILSPCVNAVPPNR